MKRIVSLSIALIMMASLVSVTCFAASDSETKVTYFEDGSYLVETIEESRTRASGTKTGTKTQTYYGSDGESAWKAVLTGTFTYTGSSATCTASSVSVTIYDTSWYTISKSASRSGNTASATVTMGCKLLGVTIDKVTTTPTLTCDKDGNLS